MYCCHPLGESPSVITLRVFIFPQARLLECIDVSWIKMKQRVVPSGCDMARVFVVDIISSTAKMNELSGGAGASFHGMIGR